MRVALAFLTRLPVGRLDADAAADLAAAAAWFPVVGLLIGGLAALTRLAAGGVLPAGPATVLALAAAVIATGALHEDGLADTADALGAHITRERRLEILRDPRVGTYGALALALAALFAYTTLVGLPVAQFARAVLVAHVLSRCSPLVQSRLIPPARRDGSGALLRTSWAALALAVALAVAAALGIGTPEPGAVAFGVAAVLTVAGSFGVRHGIGGSTGDTFGAVAKLVELGTYGVFAAFWS